MPAPIILGILALCAGGTGAGAIVSGAKDYWQSFKTDKELKQQRKEIFKPVEEKGKIMQEKLEALGKLELEINSQFRKYSSLMEKIQSRPEFDSYRPKGFKFTIPKLEELKNAELIAHTLLGSLGSATTGTLGGMAAAGLVPSIVAAVGTSGTGTAISTLSGAAAWNAILASLGGGSIAAGGGGIALGTAILGSLTGGIGILVGGVVIKLTGHRARKKQKESEEIQIELTKEKAEKLCEHLNEISALSDRYVKALLLVREKYENQIDILSNFFEKKKKTDWEDFSPSEQKEIQNTTLLVNLLYNMCRMPMNREIEDKDKTLISVANTEEVDAIISAAESTIKEIVKKPGIFKRILGRK
jgi:hypothetical protein